MDLVITGATGFIGAHVAASWLVRHPAARILCLVRSDSQGEADRRLRAAVEGALLDQPSKTQNDSVTERATAVACALDDPSWVDQARDWLRGPAEFFHCAANLSFREEDRPHVWHTNVVATSILLEAAASLPALRTFNYVSTAYVAGNREGNILEDDPARPERFNNPYEESKWEAEGVVRASCQRHGLTWRLFRPSIVIAHSVTHRMTSQSGFYQVVATILRLGREQHDVVRDPIVLPVSEATTLDLVPVDVVVREMVSLMEAGPRSVNRAFHITSPCPLSLCDVINTLSPMSGIVIRGHVPSHANEVTAASQRLMKRLQHYMPYLGIVRRFDRRSPPADLAGPAFQLDIETLSGFVRSFQLQQAR